MSTINNGNGFAREELYEKCVDYINNHEQVTSIIEERYFGDGVIGNHTFREFSIKGAKEQIGEKVAILKMLYNSKDIVVNYRIAEIMNIRDGGMFGDKEIVIGNISPYKSIKKND